eukprot:2977145-Pyramimonas_sp.AAC.1
MANRHGAQRDSTKSSVSPQLISVITVDRKRFWPQMFGSSLAHGLDGLKFILRQSALGPKRDRISR